MLLRFEDGSWILTKTLTLRGLQLFREGRAVEALPFLILDWSENEPVNLRSCYKLKWPVVRRIERALLEEVRWIVEMDQRQLLLIVKSIIKSFQAPHDRLYARIAEYVDKIMAMTDHKGNIVAWPEPGGVLDQPVDWFVIMRAYKIAFVEHLAEQNKAGGAR